MHLRAEAFGLPVVAWSRSLTAEAARLLGVQRMESARSKWRRRRHRQRARRAQRADPRTDRRGVLRRDAAGRILHQHVARRSGGSGGAGARRSRRRAFAPGWTSSPKEPAGGAGEFADEIVKLPGVYGTHHIGASTEQAQEAIAAETVRIIRTFKETRQGAERSQPGAHHSRDLRAGGPSSGSPGVLAGVLDAIRAAEINVQEMENIIFEGAQAAVARINLEQKPDAGVIEQIRSGSRHIIEIGVITL